MYFYVVHLAPETLFLGTLRLVRKTGVLELLFLFSIQQAGRHAPKPPFLRSFVKAKNPHNRVSANH